MRHSNTRVIRAVPDWVRHMRPGPLRSYLIRVTMRPSRSRIIERVSI